MDTISRSKRSQSNVEQAETGRCSTVPVLR